MINAHYHGLEPLRQKDLFWDINCFHYIFLSGTCVLIYTLFISVRDCKWDKNILQRQHKQGCLLHIRWVFQSKYYAYWATQKFMSYPNASLDAWGTNNFEDFQWNFHLHVFHAFPDYLHVPFLWKLLHTVALGAALGFSSLKMPVLIWALTLT